MTELEKALRASRGNYSREAGEAAERVVGNAEEAGLLDVAYSEVDSPVGPLIAAVTKRGLVKLSFDGVALDDVLGELAERVSPRVLEAPAKLDSVRRELDEYFEGRRKDFDLPLDWRLSHGFRRAALRQIAQIPYGEVTTYKELARAAGSPRAFRAAGSACGSNPLPLVVPCHRVLASRGGLGGYGGGLEMKRFLLKLEGVDAGDA